jgi:PAS domain-containing protein
MPSLQQATPQVKKNILLIRTLLGLSLYSFAFFFLQSHPEQKIVVGGYAAALAASFLLLAFMGEETFEKVHFQYIIFALDLLFLLGGLYLFNYLETNLLIMIFLTFFISAVSQSVGRSIFVAMAVMGIYLYLIYYKSDVFNYMDPFLLISCALLLVVAVHSGYMAYRTVQGEREVVELARKAALLSEKVREGDEAALSYAATLKNVLDSLPIGAIAVSVEGNVVFANARAGKLLDLNPKNLAGLYLFMKDSPLGDLGDLMCNSLKNRQELKKEYLDTNWKGKPRRFRLDSAPGMSLSGKMWGTLFLLQEASQPAAEAPQTPEPPNLPPSRTLPGSPRV